MYFQRGLLESGTMGFFLADVRKIRWHFAGIFSDVNSIFLDSKERKLKKKWWFFTTWTSVNARNVESHLENFVWMEDICFVKDAGNWILEISLLPEAFCYAIKSEKDAELRFLDRYDVTGMLKFMRKQVNWNSTVSAGMTDLVQYEKIGLQFEGKGRLSKTGVCFFLRPETDCFRYNLIALNLP